MKSLCVYVLSFASGFCVFSESDFRVTKKARKIKELRKQLKVF